MKIGILGGAFNPIHIGHLLMGERAYETFGLDEVWFMPNGGPPHKDERVSKDDFEHRISMLDLATKAVSYFSISLKEAKLDTASYSYSTLNSLKREFPDTQFYFILGADSLFAIEKWVCFEEIFSSCIILAAKRDDKDDKNMNEQIEYLAKEYGARIELLKTPLIEISSSDIRNRVKNGLSISYMTTEKVIDYIEKNRLYR